MITNNTGENKSSSPNSNASSTNPNNGFIDEPNSDSLKPTYCTKSDFSETLPGFKPSKPSKPCPMCGGTDKTCQSNATRNIWHCSTHTDASGNTEEFTFQELVESGGIFHNLEELENDRAEASLRLERGEIAPASLEGSTSTALNTALNCSPDEDASTDQSLESLIEATYNLSWSTFSSRKLKLSSAGKPCPLCKGTNGDCQFPSGIATIRLCANNKDFGGDREKYTFQELTDQGGMFVDREGYAIDNIIATKSQADRGYTPRVAGAYQYKVGNSDADKLDPIKRLKSGSNNFRATTAQKPCPVCEDDEGNCRSNQKDPNHLLCAGFPNTPKGNQLGNWISGGITKNGRWCSYRPSNKLWGGNSDYLKEKAALSSQMKVAAATARMAKDSLKPEIRHENYLALAAEMGLAEEDRADLLRRGLSDQEITEGGYWSIAKPFQKLHGDYHPLLPGVWKNTLQTPHLGYACPVREGGLIVACHIRKRHAAKNRYIWLSGKKCGAIHLYSRGFEMPINVCQPKEFKNRNQIGLIDSVAVKGTIAAKRLGIPIIGAAGGMFGISAEALLAGLEESMIAMGLKIAGDVSVPETPVPLPEVVCYLDAGATTNPNSMQQWFIAESILIDTGYSVVWAWWGQFEKSAGDIDEIDLATIKIEYLTTEALQKKIFLEEARKIQVPLRTLSYEPDIKIETRYLPKDLFTSGKVHLEGIVALRAPKDSGKSTVIRHLVAQYKQLAKRHRHGYYILSIVPRIMLGEAQAWDWKITWISDKGKTVTYHEADAAERKTLEDLGDHLQNLILEKEKLEADQTDRLLEDDAIGNRLMAIAEQVEALETKINEINGASFHNMGACWDSIWRFARLDMSNALIIIDEAEGGIAHLLTSDTCRKSRPAILKVLQEMIPECVKRNGLVILSDADLTDIPIDYVNGLLPAPIKPFVIRSDYRDDTMKWKVDFRTGSRDATIDESIERLRLGQNICIPTDNRKEAVAQERYIIRELSTAKRDQDLATAKEAGLPEATIQAIADRVCIELVPFLGEDGNINQAVLDGAPCLVRVDRTTTPKAAIKQFVKNIGKEVMKWQPRVLLYTPSMGCGVSMGREVTKTVNDQQVPYFDAVIAYGFGVIEPSEFRQMLVRFRPNVPRIIWSKPSGMPRDRSQSYFPEKVNSSTLKYQNQGSVNIQVVAEANLIDYALPGRGQSNCCYDDQVLLEEMWRLNKDFYNPRSRTCDNIHVITHSRLIARQNYSLAFFQKILLEELIAEGHEIINQPCQPTGAGEILNVIKEDVDMEEATAIAEARDIDESEADAIEKKGGKETDDEKLELRKFKIAKRLPEVELTPDFLLLAEVKNNGKWLEKQQLFHYLQNPENLVKRDSNEHLDMVKKGAEATPFIPDYTPLNPLIEAIKASDLFDGWIDLDDPYKKYTGDSEEAKKVMARCIENKALLRTAFHGTKGGLGISEKASPIALAKILLKALGLELTEVNKLKREYSLKGSLLCPYRKAALEGFDRAWKLANRSEAEEAWYVNGVRQDKDGNPVVSKAPAENISSPKPLFSPNDVPTLPEVVEVEQEITVDDLGETCEFQSVEGDFGTTHEPEVKWSGGYTLLALPEKFRESYLLKAADGALIPAQADQIRFVRSHESAIQVAQAFEALCRAATCYTQEDGLKAIYRRCEHYLNLGLLPLERMGLLWVAWSQALERMEMPDTFPVM